MMALRACNATFTYLGASYRYMHIDMSAGAPQLKQIVGIYLRLSRAEIERLRDNPELLPKYDPRVALQDGRGLDLGSAWADLGVFLDGGVTLPDVGPTVGEHALPETDGRAAWSYVEPARVAVIAAELTGMHRRKFRKLYLVDGEETQQPIGAARTGGFARGDEYLFNKLRLLGAHYARAAELGEGMLVRIGERV
ncbi:MAG: DUF1877 family protein [Myxococcales bacterium]|nr:DUF1877 family protein [Myxococcales bacterium]